MRAADDATGHAHRIKGTIVIHTFLQRRTGKAHPRVPHLSKLGPITALGCACTCKALAAHLQMFLCRGHELSLQLSERAATVVPRQQLLIGSYGAVAADVGHNGQRHKGRQQRDEPGRAWPCVEMHRHA